jgi:hypothetical protein
VTTTRQSEGSARRPRRSRAPRRAPQRAGGRGQGKAGQIDELRAPVASSAGINKRRLRCHHLLAEHQGVPGRRATYWPMVRRRCRAGERRRGEIPAGKAQSGWRGRLCSYSCASCLSPSAVDCGATTTLQALPADLISRVPRPRSAAPPGRSPSGFRCRRGGPASACRRRSPRRGQRCRRCRAHPARRRPPGTVPGAVVQNAAPMATETENDAAGHDRIADRPAAGHEVACREEKAGAPSTATIARARRRVDHACDTSRPSRRSYLRRPPSARTIARDLRACDGPASLPDTLYSTKAAARHDVHPIRAVIFHSAATDARAALPRGFRHTRRMPR